MFMLNYEEIYRVLTETCLTPTENVGPFAFISIMFLFNLSMTWVPRMYQESQVQQRAALLTCKEKQEKSVTAKSMQILNARKI